MFDEKIDVIEERLLHQSKRLMKLLLADKTTNNNIIWATDDYWNDNGFGFCFSDEIHAESLTGIFKTVIQPRIAKSQEKQLERTKIKAEVYTPAWVCNKQNNLVDSIWFGRENVFNTETEKNWITNPQKVEFPKDKTWQDYVDDRRLEITCGEAPYLVSRYDNATGLAIPIQDRIGLLDRKLRVVCENACSNEEWLKWGERAVQSIYGFEFQGDNLLIARENVLYTYIDYYKYFNKTATDLKNIEHIATVIAWNIWQMDGLTYRPPYINNSKSKDEFDLTLPLCRIKDWRSNRVVLFKSLLKEH